MPRHPERFALARRAASGRAGLLAAVLVGASLLLAGCFGGEEPAPPTSSPSTTESSPAATSAPTVTPEPAPTLDPAGTAGDNLPFFSAVVAAVWASPDAVSGRAYIDALVAAGFDKTSMQVTPDATTVGNPAESIMFAVRWRDECLIGQVGPATGAPVTVVVPALSEGGCLVGETRPIDW